MNDFVLALPRLSLPNITVTSTFLKLIEEISEAKKQIRILNEFENKHSVGVLTLLGEKDLDKLKAEFQYILKDTLKEIIDITQTCVSLMFVFEETKKVTKNLIEKVLNDQLNEISSGYPGERADFYITEKDGFKYMKLPTADNSMDLIELLDDIIIASGHYAQLIGKFSKLNGEKHINISEDEIVYECLKNLIRISQNSYNALIHLSKKYQINLEELFAEHMSKLKQRGYL